MGLDKNAKTPCGFSFVEYHNRKDAEKAVKYLNGTKLDDREIRIDFDWGFVEGRQFGRGKSGGQVRDEFRTDYDAGRGGYGKLIKTELEALADGDGEKGADGEGYRGGDVVGGGEKGADDAAGGGAMAADDKVVVGAKRGRDDDGDAKENPRFRGDGKDSDED